MTSASGSLALHVGLLVLLGLVQVGQRLTETGRDAFVQVRAFERRRPVAPASETPAPPLEQVELPPELPDSDAPPAFQPAEPTPRQPPEPRRRPLRPLRHDLAGWEGARRPALSPSPSAPPSPTRPAPSTTPAPTPAAPSPSGPPDRAVQVLERARLRYPRKCVRRRHRGTAIVRLTVTVAGRARDARIARSAGCSDLDAAALEAAQGYRFAPAIRKGAAVETTEDLAFRFRPE